MRRMTGWVEELLVDAFSASSTRPAGGPDGSNSANECQVRLFEHPYSKPEGCVLLPRHPTREGRLAFVPEFEQGMLYR